MKKFLLLTLLSAISIIAFANDPVKFGITGGINSSYTSIDGTSRFGYNVGVLLQIPIISNRLYLCPSVQHSARSYNFTLKYKVDDSFDSWVFSETYNYKFTYIDIPILIRLKTNNSVNNISFFTSFGPMLSYAINVYNSNIKFPSEVFNKDSDEKLNRTSCAAVINFGIEFSKRYQVSVGYNFGLTNMSNSDLNGYPKSRSIMLTLTYLL